MALYFLDTSALVKLYVREAGTEAMLALANPQQENELGLVSIAAVELRSAVRRRQRNRDIDSDAASEMLASFESHLGDRFIVQPVTEALVAGAIELVDRYFLRAYDALQLSGCLALAAKRSSCTFACSDENLLEAARSEGLLTLDPTA